MVDRWLGSSKISAKDSIHQNSIELLEQKGFRTHTAAKRNFTQTIADLDTKEPNLGRMEEDIQLRIKEKRRITRHSFQGRNHLETKVETKLAQK